MKRIIIAGLLTLAILLAGNQAFALSFSVDVPVLFKLDGSFLDKAKGAKVTEPSNNIDGFILGASAGWFGVGYEKYDVDVKAKSVGGGGTFKVGYGFQIYDIFLDLPVPVIHPVVGYGKGILNVNASPSTPPSTVDSTDVSQMFVRLGMSLGPLFDLHIGYHKITAEDAKIHGGGGPAGDKLKGSGETLTAGVRLGW